MLIAITLRTKYLEQVGRMDPVYSFASSVAYLVLLLAVIGPNADQIMRYGFGAMAGLVVKEREERIAFLFTVSKKEFSIAAALVFASGLPEEVTIPAVFYAVLQMITSPTAVKLLHWRTRKQGQEPTCS